MSFKRTNRRKCQATKLKRIEKNSESPGANPDAIAFDFNFKWLQYWLNQFDFDQTQILAEFNDAFLSDMKDKTAKSISKDYLDRHGLLSFASALDGYTCNLESRKGLESHHPSTFNTVARIISSLSKSSNLDDRSLNLLPKLAW